MAQQIQLRNGTAAQWASANPTLAVGEIGVETDTSRFKVGTGSTAWTSLAYVSGIGSLPSQTSNSGKYLTTDGTSVSWATVTSLTGTTNSASPYLTALGSGAGTNTTGVQNVVVGYGALNSNTTGAYSTAIGYQALAVCTGGQNTAIGRMAMVNATTANGSTAIGVNSLYNNTTGAGNVAVGDTAQFVLTTGSSNIAVGNGALYNNTAGSNHVAIGSQSLFNATDNNNIGIGYRAGFGISSGHNNVCIGSNAGNGTVILTTGAQNVIIGSGAYGSAAGNYTEIVIGFGCNGVGGDYVTLGKLNNRVYCHYDTNATWTQSSDVRLKKDIEDDTLGLAFINKLRPVKYRWKATNELEQDNPQYNEVNNKNTEAIMHGLIAQEVKAALDSEGVNTFGGWDVEPNGIQGISREMFVTPLINAIKELSAEITNLKSQIEELKRG